MTKKEFSGLFTTSSSLISKPVGYAAKSQILVSIYFEADVLDLYSLEAAIEFTWARMV